MSDRPLPTAPGPVSGPAPSGPTALGPALGAAFIEVRDGGLEYRRWWDRQPDREATPPWSAADEEQIGRLGSLDPWWLRSVADELERVRQDVHYVGAALSGMADTAIGGPASAMCARLAACSHERASEAGALAVSLRDAGDKVDEVLGAVVRRVVRAADDHADGVAVPPSGQAQSGQAQSGQVQSGQALWRDAGERDLGERALDDRFEEYAALLRAVRAELAAAIEELSALIGGRPEQPPARTSEPGWTPEPGIGPLLPGTEGRRVEPGYGIRIARLPDAG